MSSSLRSAMSLRRLALSKSGLPSSTSVARTQLGARSRSYLATSPQFSSGILGAWASRPASSRSFSSTPSFAAQAPAASGSAVSHNEESIAQKLKEAFSPKVLEVVDVSGGCGSFYAIEISSPKFQGLTTIKQHKLVNAVLKDELAVIHGLQLKTIPE